jgi:NitT/TauT family transport system substrate-binding protein
MPQLCSAIRLARSLLLLPLLVIAGSVSPAAAQSGATSAVPKPGATNIALRLDFSINGKHAPFALGMEKGFYADQGIALTLAEGRGSLAAVQLVANKSDLFAFADSTSLITIAAGGGAVSAVGVLQQRSPVVAISFKPLKQPTDLYGMNVGLNPAGVGSLWAAFVAQNNLDLSKINIVTMDGAALLPAVVSGRLDAIIGLVNAEGAAAPILAGKKVNLLYFADFGTNTLAHGIVVHRDTIKQQPDLIKRFMAATVKSWDYAIKNKAEAVDALLKQFPDAKRDIITRQFDVSIPLVHTENSKGRPIGFTVDQDVNATFDILTKFGGLKNRPASADVFTNEFLPATAN